jgi:hypothetical protein
LLFALFSKTRLQQTIVVGGSAALPISLLLTRNHFAVDPIGACFTSDSLAARFETDTGRHCLPSRIRIHLST